MRMTNGAATRPRRRRRRRRGLRVLGALFLVGMLVVGAGLGYGYWKWRQIPRIHLDSEVIGVVPDLTASTIAYGEAMGHPPRP